MNTKAQEGLLEYQRKLKSGEITKAKTMNPIEKARANPKSLRYAINAQCFSCSGMQKIEITLCSCKDCPLYNLRPYQKK